MTGASHSDGTGRILWFALFISLLAGHFIHVSHQDRESELCMAAI